LIDSLVIGNQEFNLEGGWNFGPEADGFVSVGQIASKAMSHWGATASWTTDSAEKLHEAQLLALDSTRAKTALGWRNKLSLDQAVAWTVDWYKESGLGESARAITLGQIDAFRRLS